MNIVKKILMGAVAIIFAVACNEGIDPISEVDPGEDTLAPSVAITNPVSNKVVIPFTDTMTDMDFKFEVEDDIEIKSITVKLDGNTIATYDNFLDYRRASKTHIQENLPIGNHTIEVSATDLASKTTTETFAFTVTNIYEARYTGEIFYMPFEGGTYTDLLSKTNSDVVGTPGFADGKIRKAYAGATSAYLTFPTAGLGLGNEFSATFWYKVNASPDRSGILTIGPPDPANPSNPNNRKNGFRFFREGSATNQTFKLNVGDGSADSWFDGGATASLNPNSAGWVHMAFTISETKCVVYFNGQVVKEGAFTGVDWTDCDILSIGSGAPRFTEWGHLSDLSLYDELRLYNKALTKEEVVAVMNGN